MFYANERKNVGIVKIETSYLLSLLRGYNAHLLLLISKFQTLSLWVYFSVYIFDFVILMFYRFL